MGEKIILHTDPISKMYIENNTLYIICYDLFTDESFKLISIKLLSFIDLCKEKNKKYNLIISFIEYKASTTPTSISNCLHYGKLFVKALDTRKEVLKTHLNGTLVITKVLISYIWPLITAFYTPARPVKFIESYEEIDFSFCNT